MGEDRVVEDRVVEDMVVEDKVVDKKGVVEVDKVVACMEKADCHLFRNNKSHTPLRFSRLLLLVYKEVVDLVEQVLYLVFLENHRCHSPLTFSWNLL